MSPPNRVDARNAIENLLFSYAERIDAGDFTGDEESQILDRAKVDYVIIDGSKLWRLKGLVSGPQEAVLWPLVGKSYLHPWMLGEAMAEASEAWTSLPSTKRNKLVNRHLNDQREEVYRLFRRPEPNN